MGFADEVQDHALYKILHEEKYKFKKYRAVGHKICKEVDEAISQSRVRFKICKWILAGSIGKKTWLGTRRGPDFDMVPLLKQPLRMTPQEILEEIGHIISRLSQRYELHRVTSHTVHFSYQSREYGELEFDVVPGLNWVTDPGTDLSNAETQLRLTMREILRDGGDLKVAFRESPFLSASLAEWLVDYFSHLDPFTHDVIKLVKLWNITRVGSFDTKISGRSFTMEVIAIHAAEREKRHGDRKTLVGAFKRALRIFAKDRERVHVVLPFPLGESNGPRSLRAQYNRMRNSPDGVILDPSNPFNNLLDNFDDDQWNSFSDQAFDDLDAIEHGDETIEFLFDEI